MLYNYGFYSQIFEFVIVMHVGVYVCMCGEVHM